MENNHDGYLPPVTTTPKMAKYWNMMSGWALFLSITGLLFTVLGLFYSIIVFFTALAMQERMGDNAGVPNAGKLLLASAGLSFLLTIAGLLLHIYHIQFSSRIKNAVRLTDQVAFERAWLALKMHFRIYGIMVILYLLAFIVSGVTFGDILTFFIHAVN